MTDDGSAPTIPETVAPTHGRSSGSARSPDERYVLKTLLGSGGMGEIWLAHDVRIDRDIAIKMMRGEGNPDAVARFLREARVQGRLEHPSVVPVHDLGGGDAAPYFAMKRLTGTTLLEVIAGAQQAWTRQKLLARFADICLAVEFAHEHGVIHRDLKPANIMLGEYGETYVLDWGLARISTDPREEGVHVSAIRTHDLRSDSGSGGMTQAGAMLGTPGYMAPEQMRGEVLDRRADVFSLGCILFEILAGVPAIPRDQTFEATLESPSHRPSVRRPDADIPPELDDACARATTNDRSKRHPTARALADEVQRFLDGDRDQARRAELSAAHATRALAAFAIGTDDARVEAMRESGRAIALDPSNRDAQQLLGRLLLEPPKHIPPAARRKIDHERELATQVVFKQGLKAYASNLVMIPLVKLAGVGGVWPFVVVGGLLVLQMVMCWLASRRPHRITAREFWMLVIGHVVLLATVGVYFGALIFVPLFAFGSLPLMVMFPQMRFPYRALLLHLGAFMVPIVLELTHLIPSDFRAVGHTLVFEPWAVDVAPMVLIAILVVVAAAQMFVTVNILDTQRQKQDRFQEQVHVQTWQLGQLVTTDE